MIVEFCLPVKNEEGILSNNALRLRDYLLSLKPSYNWRIVIIVNGSDDSSAEIASGLVKFSSDFLVHTISLGGKGRALREYFNQSKADILVFMDIDLAVSLDNLPGLITPIISNDADLVIGSRLLSGSKTERSFFRSITSHCYNWLSRLLLGHPFFDLQCGFKAIKRDLFSKLSSNILDNSWFFDTELVVCAFRSRAKILELPIDWQENRYDERKSKIRVIYDVWSFIWNLFKLRRRL